MYLYNFMMNRVPTDLYRVKNPKYETVTAGGTKASGTNNQTTDKDLADENEVDK